MNKPVKPLKDIFNLKLNKISVENFHNKNQFLITYQDNENTFLVFQSYETLIAIYDKTNKRLAINWRYWDYSKTTLKHLSLFIQEETNLDYDNKQAFLKKLLSLEEIELFE